MRNGVEAARIARQKGAASRLTGIYPRYAAVRNHSDYTIEYRWACYPETVDPTQQKRRTTAGAEIPAQQKDTTITLEMVSAFAAF